MSDTFPPAETPTPRSVEGYPRWEPPAPAELQAWFPDYDLERLVGRGGMGAVYQARQLSLNRPVALKIIAADLDEPDDANYVERFKNEARAMARLSHSSIVAVYDFGQTANGLLYIGMEYVEGTDVARMLEQQERLQPKHALALTAQVCAALAYAHERGIIHRDIKPANIMVGFDDVVKVADFGLAKIHGSDGQTLGLTQSGMAMGTLHYMAPESHILGTAVDHRADIYAVGVMLYQMITGKLPHGMFKPPSQQVPGLDPRYDAIITQAMRADRDRRYQTIEELRQDLSSLLTRPMVQVKAKAAEEPAAQRASEIPHDYAELESPQSLLFAKIRPLVRGLSDGGAFLLFAALTAAAVALAGYAALTVAGKFWHSPADEAPPAIKHALNSKLPAQPPTPSSQPVKSAAPATASPPAAVPAQAATGPVASSVPKGLAAKTPVASRPEPVGHLPPGSQAKAIMPKPVPPTASLTATKPLQTSTAKESSVFPTKMPTPVFTNDTRLARLEAEFDKFWHDEMQQPFQTELADIRKRYLDIGLAQARAVAKQQGLEGELRALDAEIALVQSGAVIPVNNAPGTPSSIATLRRLYHQRLSEYVAGRQIMAPPVVRAQLRGFDTYIKELLDAGRLAEAQRVQSVRDSKANLRLK